MRTTQQTLEVLAAIVAISHRHREHMADDGRESGWELLGYIKDRGKIKLALEGIKEVPLELADLTADEVPEISAAVSLILNEWGVNHRNCDITSDVIKCAVRIVPHLKLVIEEFETLFSTVSKRPPTATLA